MWLNIMGKHMLTINYSSHCGICIALAICSPSWFTKISSECWIWEPSCLTIKLFDSIHSSFQFFLIFWIIRIENFSWFIEFCIHFFVFFNLFFFCKWFRWSNLLRLLILRLLILVIEISLRLLRIVMTFKRFTVAF